MTNSLPVLREVQCKSILNRSAISDYSLNCYVGCTHSCVYCYARFMQRFHPHPEPWGEFVDVKVNAVEALRKQLRRAEPGEVFMSSAYDGWQAIEKERELTRECCRLLLERGFQVNVLTKSSLVLRDLPLLSNGKSQIGVTLTTLEEPLRQQWEPQASPVSERLKVLEEAKRAGMKTMVMFGPLLPFLSDSQESLDALFEQAANHQIDSIIVDAMNARPKVWPSVVTLLRKKNPELLPSYSSILHNQHARDHYLDQLRKRVDRAANRCSVSDRMVCCF